MNERLEPCSSALDFILRQCLSVSGQVPIGGPGELADLTLTHLGVSLVALAAAVVLMVPLGLYLGHTRRGEFLAIAISNVGRAVPALALLAIFLAYIGTGFTNVAIVMFLLGAPPILQNTYTGMTQVDRDVVDSARGMGMSDGQIIRKIELPLALPIMFAGFRLASVFVLATATIAPYADVRTLGEPIINEQIYGGEGQVGAAIVIALITLAADRAIGLAQRAVTPKGLKLAREERRPRRRRRIRMTFPTRREKTT